jgi:DNA-binding MarR family transcriptional regulator
VEKEDKTGVSEIATYLQISNNTASEHVKRMIEKKYLIKIRNPDDERKVILGLTDDGKEVLHRHTSLDEKKLERLIGELNEEEIQMIEQAFKLLSERSKQ